MVSNEVGGEEMELLLNFSELFLVQVMDEEKFAKCLIKGAVRKNDRIDAA